MFKVDFIDGTAVSWRKTGSGIERREHPDYHPRFYIGGDRSDLHRSRPWISGQDGVEATCFEIWRPTLSKPEQTVLRVDASSEESLKSAVNKLKKGFGRSSFRFYNVGLSPQFRFCLQNEVCPVPEEDLSLMELELPRHQLADERLEKLRIDGDPAGKKPLQALRRELRRSDPDILVVNRGQLLELIDGKMRDEGMDFPLGRIDGFRKVADENIVQSYGKTVHSASRFNVPGRILIDRSNSFLLGEATLEGLWDLVERSYRPMQELAWGSIGRLLTSIEIRRAYLEENTLTPWKNWRGETPKKASKMHRGDRGGFIFNPEPSIHRDVYEADFASLFPNIMVEKNISPETVGCDCCSNEKVPELDYTICEEKKGFIPKVLRPLIEDRQGMKRRLQEDIEPGQRKYLQGSVDAIKWLLVSCFGYMGHSHASYGAISCHQAIQAFDREIMVRTKEMFEDSGYSIAHGIIDSIWVQEEEDPKEFRYVCREITDEIGIKLEPEHRFEWVAFVPRASSDGIATLNRYFGKKRDGGFKTAGIETEQDSSSDFVQERQMEMIRALDREMEPGDVIEVVRDATSRLQEGEVPVEKLVRTKRVSKPLEAYRVENRTVAALKRARQHGIDIRPGQEAEFVVREDRAPSRKRVRLAFEAGEYDADFYTDQLVRAAESVLSPLGLDREDIRRRLSDERDALITEFA